MRIVRLCVRPAAAQRAVAFVTRQNGDTHWKREMKSCQISVFYGTVFTNKRHKKDYDNDEVLIG